MMGTMGLWLQPEELPWNWRLTQRREDKYGKRE